MKPIEVDGYVYTKDDIAMVRQTVINWRDESMSQWPEAIPFTTTATHLIGLLHGVLEQYPE